MSKNLGFGQRTAPQQAGGLGLGGQTLQVERPTRGNQIIRNPAQNRFPSRMQPRPSQADIHRAAQKPSLPPPAGANKKGTAAAANTPFRRKLSEAKQGQRTSGAQAQLTAGHQNDPAAMLRQLQQHLEDLAQGQQQQQDKGKQRLQDAFELPANNDDDDEVEDSENEDDAGRRAVKTSAYAGASEVATLRDQIFALSRQVSELTNELATARKELSAAQTEMRTAAAKGAAKSTTSDVANLKRLSDELNRLNGAVEGVKNDQQRQVGELRTLHQATHADLTEWKERVAAQLDDTANATYWMRGYVGVPEVVGWTHDVPPCEANASELDEPSVTLLRGEKVLLVHAPQENDAGTWIQARLLNQEDGSINTAWVPLVTTARWLTGKPSPAAPTDDNAESIDVFHSFDFE